MNMNMSRDRREGSSLYIYLKNINSEYSRRSAKKNIRTCCTKKKKN